MPSVESSNCCLFLLDFRQEQLLAKNKQARESSIPYNSARTTKRKRRQGALFWPQGVKLSPTGTAMSRVCGAVNAPVRQSSDKPRGAYTRKVAAPRHASTPNKTNHAHSTGRKKSLRQRYIPVYLSALRTKANTDARMRH